MKIECVHILGKEVTRTEVAFQFHGIQDKTVFVDSREGSGALGSSPLQLRFKANRILIANTFFNRNPDVLPDAFVIKGNGTLRLQNKDIPGVKERNVPVILGPLVHVDRSLKYVYTVIKDPIKLQAEITKVKQIKVKWVLSANYSAESIFSGDLKKRLSAATKLKFSGEMTSSACLHILREVAQLSEKKATGIAFSRTFRWISEGNIDAASFSSSVAKIEGIASLTFFCSKSGAQTSYRPSSKSEMSHLFSLLSVRDYSR